MALNHGDLEGAEFFVDVGRYREECIAFTQGWVNWTDAKSSMKAVWQGLPDLRVELTDVMEDGDAVLAHGSVSGTAKGKLYGAPATNKSYNANFFDFVRVDNGLIVERIQQADLFVQMRELYGRGRGLIGIAAMFWRQGK
jgi:predicted ester cyclase